ncbi:MAG: hypothetical protein J1F71_01895 [Clostridiales bacterium]|nr:hypothetical protein [Clostridiales bacterium]
MSYEATAGYSEQARQRAVKNLNIFLVPGSVAPLKMRFFASLRMTNGQGDKFQFVVQPKRINKDGFEEKPTVCPRGLPAKFQFIAG